MALVPKEHADKLKSLPLPDQRDMNTCSALTWRSRGIAVRKPGTW